MGNLTLEKRTEVGVSYWFMASGHVMDQPCRHAYNYVHFSFFGPSARPPLVKKQLDQTLNPKSCINMKSAMILHGSF